MRQTYVQGVSGELRQFCRDKQRGDILAVDKRLDIETKGRTDG
jgi:hypothetical protein